MEEAVCLDVEDEIELFGIFVPEKMAAFHAGGVQQHVDTAAALPDLFHDVGHSIPVGKVDAEVIRCAACCSDRVDSDLCSLCTLQCGKFFLHQGRGCSVSACLNAGK